MGPRFLCSRSELFRSLDLDTGVRPLFISPQDGFMEWIDKVIPASSLTVNGVKEIPGSEIFDLVLLWPRNGRFPEHDEISKVLDHVSSGDRIWAVLPSDFVPKEINERSENQLLDDSFEPIFLTTMNFIVKLRIPESLRG